jgi:hypothetical protein
MLYVDDLNSSKKVLASQVRGQRISREELIAEAGVEHDKAWVNNCLRAEFIAELAPVVSHNPAPILCQQQPKVRPFPDKFWETAHHLVADYLFENRLVLTLKTASTEFPAFPDGHISASSSSAHLLELAQPRDDECFSDRVKKQGVARKAAPPEPPAPPPPEKSDESVKKAPHLHGRHERKFRQKETKRQSHRHRERRKESHQLRRAKEVPGRQRGDTARNNSASLNEGD